MKIGQKLTLGFVSMACLVVTVGLVSIGTSQRVLHDRIGQASSALADEIMRNIDKNIYTRIETFQEYVKTSHVQTALIESNRAFEADPDVLDSLDQQDRNWASAAPKQTTPFMRNIIGNALSQELRDKAEFYNGKCNYRVFGEVFITNRFGANIAQTGKTSDYSQADEAWWQAARQRGLYMGSVAHDASADLYSTDICLRIDDRGGQFLGIAKIVLNIEETMALILEAIDTDLAADFKLLNRDWQIIYAGGKHRFLEPLDDALLLRFQACEEESGRHHFIAKGQGVKEEDELFGYAHSRGYKDYKGLGWILAIEQEAKDIFAPVQTLQLHILTASLAISILAIVIGSVISRSIGRSLGKLTLAATEIGKGNLETRVDVTSHDEIGFLAQAFNAMVHSLAEITTSKKSLTTEITLHQQTEEELRCTKEALEKQLEDMTLIQDAALNMMEDISNENAERKQAEKMLKQAKKEAELANESKSQFLANMSHEVRTPMNAIVGFSEILASETLTEQQRKHVNTICSSGKYLLQVINDILDFSKIEAGKMSVVMDRCSLHDLLSMAETMMQPLAREKGILFEFRADDNLPAHMVTDFERLQQCLINLINNAIKFTEVGHVCVHVSLETRNCSPFMRFDVEDTGIGVPLDKQATIFQSFSQVDGSSSRKYGGTGLGLAITQQLASLLGGEISLTSEMGKGSTFSLILPAGVDISQEARLDRHQVAEQRPIKPEEDPLAEPVFSGHVLVAEDVTANQALIKILLERMHLKVTIVQDGHQAVETALAQSFDIILMDIQMPNMNGHEATQTLRASGVETPIVALTAHAMKGDIETCLASGCDGYMSKPISVQKLRATIGRYLPSQEVAIPT